MNAIREMAHKAGYLVETYSPGDGVTRYKFFALDEMARKGVSEREQSYFGPLDGKHTALGLAAAKKWLEKQAKPHRHDLSEDGEVVANPRSSGRSAKAKKNNHRVWDQVIDPFSVSEARTYGRQPIGRRNPSDIWEQVIGPFSVSEEAREGRQPLARRNKAKKSKAKKNGVVRVYEVK
jgi:hypothetical protein